jgi:hypothetical protein
MSLISPRLTASLAALAVLIVNLTCVCATWGMRGGGAICQDDSPRKCCSGRSSAPDGEPASDHRHTRTCHHCNPTPVVTKAVEIHSPVAFSATGWTAGPCALVAIESTYLLETINPTACFISSTTLLRQHCALNL